MITPFVEQLPIAFSLNSLNINVLNMKRSVNLNKVNNKISFLLD